MSEQKSHIDQFCENSEANGVPVHRTDRGDVANRLSELCEPATVAVPLPWDDVTLPDEATVRPTPAELETAMTGVTPAGAVADYGSLLIRSTADGAEPMSLFPERHVAVVDMSDVHPTMESATAALGPACRDEGASAIVATGPSATADMGELVHGAHGPTDVEVILFEGEQ